MLLLLLLLSKKGDLTSYENYVKSFPGKQDAPYTSIKILAFCFSQSEVPRKIPILCCLFSQGSVSPKGRAQELF